MSEIIIGDSTNLKPEIPSEDLGMVYKSYLTKDLVTVCFEQYECTDGSVYWNFPMVLDTAMQKDPNTGEVSKQSYLRPFLPISKGMKFKQIAKDCFLCEVEDERLKDAYYRTLEGIKAQISGIELPRRMTVGTGPSIIS